MDEETAMQIRTFYAIAVSVALAATCTLSQIGVVPPGAIMVALLGGPTSHTQWGLELTVTTRTRASVPAQPGDGKVSVIRLAIPAGVFREIERADALPVSATSVVLGPAVGVHIATTSGATAVRIDALGLLEMSFEKSSVAPRD
jgi:hypothetical protein